MPIVGWDCPVCKARVPLDHYATTACGLAIHPDYAQAILDDRAEPHHSEGIVTVTMGLTCPRSRALENAEDAQLYVNPLDYNALLIGQAWDKFITGEKLVLVGTIAGIPMAGEVDRVRRLGTDLLIEDWKHSNNFQQRFLKKDVDEGRAIKTEYRIQTSIYAELYSQMNGERPNKGMVWNHYSGAPGPSNRVLWPLIYDTIPLDEALAYKPYGGDYTVLELYQQAAQLYADEPVKWSDLPLVGETMSFGPKSYCDYCQVRTKCFEEAKGAPF